MTFGSVISLVLLLLLIIIIIRYMLCVCAVEWGRDMARLSHVVGSNLTSCSKSPVSSPGQRCSGAVGFPPMELDPTEFCHTNYATISDSIMHVIRAGTGMICV